MIFLLNVLFLFFTYADGDPAVTACGHTVAAPDGIGCTADDKCCHRYPAGRRGSETDIP